MLSTLAVLVLGLAPDDVIAAQETFQQDLFEKVAPSVVFISTGKAFGSGFAVSPTLVLTNHHVVEEAKNSKVKVVLRTGRVVQGEVVELGQDKVDVALVEVKDPLPVAPLLHTPALRVGAWVSAIGHGEGSVWTFNTGMVTNVYSSNSQRRVFQTQIPVNPGNSGGPIIDRHGRVVGIVTAGISGANSMNFGIDLAVAFQSLPRLRTASDTLTFFAPPNVPIFVNGKTVGTGPSVSIPPLTSPATAFAVVDGAMVQKSVSTQDREVYLGVSPDAGTPATPPSSSRKPLSSN